jgi:DNA-binding NarL/FixJ family response regulator
MPLGTLACGGRTEARSLTPRELEVLELASDGLTAKMIAEELTISSLTVKSHFEHIRAKLGVADRTAADLMSSGRCQRTCRTVRGSRC